MRRMLVLLAAIGTTAVGWSGAARAQEFEPAAYGEMSRLDSLEAEVAELRQRLDASLAGEGGGSCCCDSCRPSGWVFEAEALFLRYNRADGVRVGDNEGQETARFDYEFAPRVTIGYVARNGLGIRARYFEYDHSETDIIDAGSSLTVDTWLLDVEVFETFYLNCDWSMEVSGGLRYNEFAEVMADTPGGATAPTPANTDVRHVLFHGIGAVAGMELKRSVSYGALYGRVRVALLTDDRFLRNDDNGEGETELLTASSVGMLEIALGYEARRCMANGAVLYGRVGAEWQNWFNYTHAFEDTITNEDFGGPSDAGFFGFGLTLGVRR